MKLIIHKLVNPVCFGKPHCGTGSVLPATLDEVTCHANVKCPIPMASENIDTRVLHDYSELDTRLRGYDGVGCALAIGNTIVLTTLLYPNPVIPAEAGIQVGVSFGGIPADSLRG